MTWAAAVAADLRFCWSVLCPGGEDGGFVLFLTANPQGVLSVFGVRQFEVLQGGRF